MANYINSNILCQAYLRIEDPVVEEKDLPALKENLQNYIQRGGKFLLYPEVQTNVEFGKGSLIEYLTIAGSLVVALGAYTDFRAAVNRLNSDVKRLAEGMIVEAQISSRARSSTVKRSEARTGVVGQLKDILDQISHASEGIDSVRVKTLSTRLGIASDSATKLLSVLKSDEDIEMVSREVAKELETLPAKPKEPKGYVADAKSSAAYDAHITNLKRTLHEYLQKSQQAIRAKKASEAT